MQYIVASVLSFIVQNMSNKEFSRRLPCKLHGLALFNAIALTFCAGALAVAGGIGTLSGGAWLLALAFAITFDVTVVLIVISMSMGPMGATVLIINMSMMLPVTAGLVVWGEQLTLLKGLGIACMLLVLVLSALGARLLQARRRKVVGADDNHDDKRWRAQHTAEDAVYVLSK